MSKNGQIVWMSGITENNYISAPHHRVDRRGEIGSTGNVNIGQRSQGAAWLFCSIDVLFCFLTRVIRRFNVDDQQKRSPSINGVDFKANSSGAFEDYLF